MCDGTKTEPKNKRKKSKVQKGVKVRSVDKKSPKKRRYGIWDPMKELSKKRKTILREELSSDDDTIQIIHRNLGPPVKIGSVKDDSSSGETDIEPLYDPQCKLS